MPSFPFMLSVVNGFPLELSSRALARRLRSAPEQCARARSAPRVGTVHTLAHSQHITYPVPDVSGLSCRAQLRSARLVWQTLETCSTLCTTSEFT